MIYPISRVIQYSFYDNQIINPAPLFVGVKNFFDLARDPIFWQSLKNTIFLTTISVTGHLVVGMVLAILLNQPVNHLVLSVFRGILILPWIFTAVVVALNWQLLLNPLGIVNYMLQNLGIIHEAIDWFGDDRYAMPALIIVNIWRGYPFLMISILGGLQAIPKSHYDAAQVDGCNTWQGFWHITIPGLKPVLFSVGLLDTIWTFRLFPLVWLLTGGGPGRSTEVLATFTYRFAFVNFQFSKASAVAVILLIFTMIFTWFYLKYQQQAE
jgi:multiple sugar transport system permease protein